MPMVIQICFCAALIDSYSSKDGNEAAILAMLSGDKAKPVVYTISTCTLHSREYSKWHLQRIVLLLIAL